MDTSHTGTGISRVLPERRKPGRIGKSKDATPMMNEHGKSDGFIVPEKSPNKAVVQAAEGTEGRNPTKGNSGQQNTGRTQCRESVHSALERVRAIARKDERARFTALLHHIYDRTTLELAFLSLKRSASAGTDGETWQHYGEALGDNLQSLAQRLKRGAYRARPVRRVYIPKGDGRQRPLGVTALEDKLVQRAMVEVLNAIYETDFQPFSYGFRPGRSQHQALDALYVGINKRQVNWVLDVDIKGFFDGISHEWLIKFMEHRIADRRVIRLIQKWLKAGVLEEGKLIEMEEGTPQGGSASPLLANVYLHYVFDLWVQAWRKKRAHGDVIVVRYADDIVVGFQEKADAEQFWKELTERMRKFNLELHPEKTRLLEFGRKAAENRQQRGEGKPEVFNFLGFTHVCGKSKRGRFLMLRHTIRKRLQAKLKEIKLELKRRMHDSVPEMGQWLRAVVRGHFRYYGVPTNKPALGLFWLQVGRLWRHALSQRSQNGRLTWKRTMRLIRSWLPPPRICHPYPTERLRVRT
jgi:RNA-directed DNA polymerase